MTESCPACGALPIDQVNDPARPSDPPFTWLPGLPLNVVHSSEPGHWTRDYRPDHVVYFAGWTWDRAKQEPDIWVSDQWPPKGNGDLTDGWAAEHLTVAHHG